MSAYRYAAPNYPSPVASLDTSRIMCQPVSWQQQFGHGASCWACGTQTQSAYSQQYLLNYSSASGAAIGHTSNSMPFRINHAVDPLSHQDNHPVYETDYSAASAPNQHLVRNLVGPNDKQNPSLSRTLEPSTSCVEQMAHYDRQYSKPTSPSNSRTVPQIPLSLTERHCIGDQLTVVAKAKSGHQKTTSMEISNRKFHQKLAEQGALLRKNTGKQISEDYQDNEPKAKLLRNHAFRKGDIIPLKLHKKTHKPAKAQLQQLSKRARDCMDQG